MRGQRTFVHLTTSRIFLESLAEPVRRDTASRSDRIGANLHCPNRGYVGSYLFAPMLEGRPMSRTHDEYLGPPSCPKCGVLILVPETSAYVDDHQIRHGWSCV